MWFRVRIGDFKILIFDTGISFLLMILFHFSSNFKIFFGFIKICDLWYHLISKISQPLSHEISMQCAYEHARRKEIDHKFFLQLSVISQRVRQCQTPLTVSSKASLINNNEGGSAQVGPSLALKCQTAAQVFDAYERTSLSPITIGTGFIAISIERIGKYQK